MKQTITWYKFNKEEPIEDQLPYRTVMIAIKYKYRWESGWRYETQIATNMPEYLEWYNDWYEGQQDIVYVGWALIPDPPKELLK